LQAIGQSYAANGTYIVNPEEDVKALTDEVAGLLEFSRKVRSNKR